MVDFTCPTSVVEGVRQFGGDSKICLYLLFSMSYKNDYITKKHNVKKKYAT